MGDVVQISKVRRSRPRRRAESGETETGTIALFTGVRIERWSERETGSADAPRSRPTPPSRRRRRT